MTGVLFTGLLPTVYERFWIERQLRRVGRKIEEFAFAEEASVSLVRELGIKVIVSLTGQEGKKKHGYYVDTPWGIPSIATFHPRFIMKGNQKFSGAWCFAVTRAVQIAQGTEQLRKYELLMDPSLSAAQNYFAAGLDTLVCDIETNDWDGDEDEAETESTGNIVRISFSNAVGTGVSFPWLAPYTDLCKSVLRQAKKVVFWNQQFDLPRLQAAGCVFDGKVVDAMFAWHWLQSDLPKALGYVAPFWAMLRPWKHLNSARPAYYSAMDSAVTMDCYLGIREQLEADGRWGDFERQCVRMFPILTSMSRAGVKLDVNHQQQFKSRLELERDEKLAQIQGLVPLEVRPTKIYKRKPRDTAGIFEQESPVPGAPAYEAPEVRWVKVLPFNPASPKQVKALIRHLGLKVPTAKGKGDEKESTESKHLRALGRKNKIFHTILEYRERCKIIDSYIWGCSFDGRVHTSFSFAPSTWRKSCRNPNVQTVPKRNDLAVEFRRMVVADSGMCLVECDSSAIEAVLVGYFGNSERYIQLAKAGVHKWLASEYAGRPVSKSEPLYDQIKRVVHLSNYMGTPRRIHEEYSELFGSVKEAKALQDFYFGTEPGKDVRAWQQATLQQAHKDHKLDTPFGQRHYFYDVFTYRDGNAVMGDDAKRAVAFRPQATASAIQTEFVLEIADRHGWMLPHLRWLVHDSIIAEVPEGDAERFARELMEVMQMSFPQLGGLSIGCEAKIGPNLASMREVKL